jgi:hypothetical protein
MIRDRCNYRLVPSIGCNPERARALVRAHGCFATAAKVEISAFRDVRIAKGNKRRAGPINHDPLTGISYYIARTSAREYQI